MAVQTAHYTDRGVKKQVNEDSLVVRVASTVNGPLVMAAVCDGMGGLSRGELASGSVVQALSEWFDGQLPLLLEDGYDLPTLRDGLEREIGRMSQALADHARAAGIRMGTTLAMLLLYDGHCVTVNVGDSRVYELAEELRQLTRDHSLVQLEVEEGRLRPEDAEKDSRRNVLLQCLGEMTRLAPEIQERPWKKGAVYLLCSDGFRHELTAAEIGEKLRSGAEGGRQAMEEALKDLAGTAMDRGETDNITAVTVLLRD